jgi:ketosteroid isomerase-like protein
MRGQAPVDEVEASACIREDEADVSDSETAKANVEIVQTMAANGRLGNWDVVRPLVSDDIVVEIPEGLPYGETFHGWDGYRAALAALDFWTDLNIGPAEFAAAGDKVVVIAPLSGRIGPDGPTVSQPYAAVWQLAGGKVVRITAFYYDTKEIADLASR